jgi:archaellum component FlaC
MTESNAMPAKRDKSGRSWPKRVAIAVLRPCYIILLRPFARPLARRLRGFFLIPVTEQITALRHDLAELDLKFGSIVSTLQLLEGKARDAEQGMQRSLQPPQTEMVSTLQVLEGKARDAEQGMQQSLQRLQTGIASILQVLEGKARDAEQGMQQSLQRLRTETDALRESMRVENGGQRPHQDVQRLQADVESVRQSLQRLEGSTNDIRRDINNEISAMGRSIRAVLASLSVASERP